MAVINFFVEDIDFKVPLPRKTSNWIITAINFEKKKPSEVNYVFCSDSYLLQINNQYLRHNTYTDIVTFDTTETKGEIRGDIFISIDRVIENAQKFNSLFIDELHRVMIHGILHLCGYKDKSIGDKKEMRKKEDAYLSLRDF